MTGEWTNAAAISQWDAMPRAALDALEPDGGFAKRTLLNPVLLRLAGEVAGRRVLDAGCGTGYFSRMLAARGATVAGLEPAGGLVRYAAGKETGGGGPRVRYLQADLCALPGLAGAFDVVVSSMVLMGVPDWRAALAGCVTALAPGGRLVLALVHPCFEQLAPSWRAHGEYRVREYLAEYEIPERYAPDFHRPLSAYLNELARLGCALREMAEPGLDPAVAEAAGDDGARGYVHLPNFLVIAADGAGG